MYPVSARFLQTYRQPTSQLANLAQIIGANGEVLAELDVDSGSVSSERDRAVRATCTVTLADPDGTLSPSAASDLLAPIGVEIRLWRGFRYPDGTRELASLGVFGFNAVDIDDSADGVSIGITGQDRSARITAARFTDPYKIARNLEISDAIEELLNDRWGDVTVDLPATGYTTARTFLEAGDSSDPWRDAQELARAAGMQLAFDADGVVRYDELNTEVSATYTDGSDAALLDLSRTMSAEETRNGVVATGEGTDLAEPARAVVWDDDPASPTYYEGPFGQRPGFYTSSLIKDDDQAESVAIAELARLKGLAHSVSWSQLTNPARQVNDRVAIIRAPSNTSATLIVDSVTIGMRAGDSLTSNGRVISEA